MSIVFSLNKVIGWCNVLHRGVIVNFCFPLSPHYSNITPSPFSPPSLEERVPLSVVNWHSQVKQPLNVGRDFGLKLNKKRLSCVKVNLVFIRIRVESDGRRLKETNFLCFLRDEFLSKDINVLPSLYSHSVVTHNHIEYEIVWVCTYWISCVHYNVLPKKSLVIKGLVVVVTKVWVLEGMTANNQWIPLHQTRSDVHTNLVCYPTYLL